MDTVNWGCLYKFWSYFLNCKIEIEVRNEVLREPTGTYFSKYCLTVKFVFHVIVIGDQKCSFCGNYSKSTPTPLKKGSTFLKREKRDHVVPQMKGNLILRTLIPLWNWWIFIQLLTQNTTKRWDYIFNFRKWANIVIFEKFKFNKKCIFCGPQQLLHEHFFPEYYLFTEIICRCRTFGAPYRCISNLLNGDFR